MKRPPYDQLAIMPSVIGDTVAERAGLNRETAERFGDYVDARCREAYQHGSEWFLRIARSQSNRGRDTMYAFAAHWLPGWLKTESSAGQ